MRIALSIVLLLALSHSQAACVAAENPPNLIVIFCDDLGYGDLGCFGSTKNRTPRIDSLADQGMRFTNFYSSSPVCTPSRASLLTGCYPRRVGMHEDFTGHWVLIPRSRRGLNPDEITVAEALKSKGFATACVGKWHLGDQPEHLPQRHGFDYYYGIPYSNDMQSARRGDPPLPLVKQDAVIEAPADQATLTKRYTEQVISFIEDNKTKPFFVYLPHTFPHLPLFASPDFRGKSANGRYGDSVEEIDWSTGQILACLDRLKLAKNTLVIFTSDNGSNGRNGGSNLPLSGAKGSTMEGGMRVPMIARWPGRIAAGSTCHELATTMDILPTFCSLTGASLPLKKIDGFDISGMLFQQDGARSKYKALYYYRRRQLQAIRVGDWKYHLPLKMTHPNWTSAKQTGRGRPGKLVNLKSDLQEQTNVANANPDVLKRMRDLRRDAVATLGNDEVQGSEQREARTLDSSVPMTLAGERPNIVVCMADDWSWPHAGILGDPVVKTPHFDRIARQGVLFERAFVSTPSCTPSRLSVLTGQHHWRLQEGDSLGGSLREKFDVYTEMLARAGYRTGRFGKGVWPSKHTFRKRDSFGKRFRSFDEFLKSRKPGEPFCYWHGGQSLLGSDHEDRCNGRSMQSILATTEVPLCKKQQSRPACLAAYKALSARSTTAWSSSSFAISATPALVVTDNSRSP